MAGTRYLAFLRAINVGGRIVKMAQLKEIFEAAGFADVTTFIASGNVIFRSRAAADTLEPKIERALQSALGFTVATIVRTSEEVARVADHQAYPAKALEGAALYIGFIQHAPSPTAVKKVLALQTDIDSLRVDGREIYWLARRSIADSTISMAALEKALAIPSTFRNINTVRKLALKYPPL